MPALYRVRNSAEGRCAWVSGFSGRRGFAGQRLADALPPAWEGRDIQVVGVVASLPQPYERSVRFEFDVERVLTPQARRCRAHIALSWWGTAARRRKAVNAAGAASGRTLAASRCGCKRPHGTVNPHGFDYEAWLLERGIRATGYVRPAGQPPACRDGASGRNTGSKRMREALRERIRHALPDATVRRRASTALAIGDQRAIPPEQWQVFTRTGVNHLMSISGLHVTMVSGLVFWLGLLAVAPQRAPDAVRCRRARRRRWPGLLAALAYALLAGFAVPAQRTLYMLAVVALALWSGRADFADARCWRWRCWWSCCSIRGRCLRPVSGCRSARWR